MVAASVDAQAGRLRVLCLDNGDRPDPALLRTILGRPVRLLSLMSTLKSLRENYRASISGRSQQDWRARFNRVAARNQVVFLGPLEDISAPTSRLKSETEIKNLQCFLYALSQGFCTKEMSVVLYSNTSTEKIRYLSPSLRNMIHLSKKFSSYIEILSDDTINRSTEEGNLSFVRRLTEQVNATALSALEPYRSRFTEEELEALKSDLSGAFAGSIVENLKGALDSFETIDEVSGLTLPPRPRSEFKNRAGNERDRSAGEYLNIVWGDYVSAGILYSGHLKKLDKGLYLALLNTARETAKGLAHIEGREWCPKDTMRVFFEKYNVVTELQLIERPKDRLREIELVVSSIESQKKSLREKMNSALEVDA